jgi:DNA ligase (NAD+)
MGNFAKIKEEHIEYLTAKAKALGYPIDGLVFKFDDVEYGRSLGATEHHSNNAIAYKFYDEEYETKLLDIEWTMGRTGVLTPVAIVEPVDTGDSIVERASLHNLTVMRETLGETPFWGQPVKLIKSNMIIPQIVWAAKGIYIQDTLINIPMVCPICGGSIEVIGENDSEFLSCANPMCQGKLINRLDHFCSKKGLDIKGLSSSTLEKLIEWGWVSSITDIFNLKTHAREWMRKPGFGPKSVENILNAIESSKNCDFVNFVTALGIPLVGTATAKELLKEFKTWAEFRNAVSESFKFYSLAGFGIEMHHAILYFDYAEADILAGEYLNIQGASASEGSASLQGITVVITGKLKHFKNRDEFQKLIEAAGGKVAGSVSKNTSYLVNNDTESSSSKNLTAKKLGVEILSEEDFIQKFLTL